MNGEPKEASPHTDARPSYEGIDTSSSCCCCLYYLFCCCIFFYEI